MWRIEQEQGLNERPPECRYLLHSHHRRCNHVIRGSGERCNER
jgi:hypothetical protein